MVVPGTAQIPAGHGKVGAKSEAAPKIALTIRISLEASKVCKAPISDVALIRAGQSEAGQLQNANFGMR